MISNLLVYADFLSKYTFKTVRQTTNNKLVGNKEMQKMLKERGVFFAATYTCKGTCPAACPFLQDCYAKHGPANIHWNNAKSSLQELKQFVDTLPPGAIIRHNVAGDIAEIGHTDRNTINPALVFTLTEIFAGKIAYTYTHCTPYDSINIDIVKQAAARGFCINFSCETFEQVEKAYHAGAPVVLAVETMKEKELIINGIKYVRCNADKEKRCCATCRKCFNANRNFVPVLPAHGNDGTIKDIKKRGFLMNI